MDLSILDIDEVLQDDSFILLAEDEAIDKATNVFKSWRLNNGQEENSASAEAGPKGSALQSANGNLFDTRTFTRPKKRSSFEPMSFNETVTMGSSMNNPNVMNTTVDLQIGGLVTTKNGGQATGSHPLPPFTMTHSSMQKSLIGDISPPSSICSSMGPERGMIQSNITNSLVTSSDFKHANFFLSHEPDDLPKTNVSNGEAKNTTYEGYNMADAMKDCEMLQNMTFNSLSETVVIKDDLKKPVIADQTFGQANETFDLIGLGQSSDSPSIKKDLESIKISPIGHVVVGHQPEVKSVKAIDEEDIRLDFKQDNDSIVQSTPICRDKSKQADMFNFSPTGNEELYRTMELNKKNISFGRAVANAEKEVVDEKEFVDLLSQTIVQTDGEKIIDLVEMRKKGLLPKPIDMLRDDERQSLTNFEEYEKSLQLLDDNRNEKDFDEMLESLDNLEMKQNSMKMRQSLDHIKKRHSLVNYEKQQEELRKKASHIDNEINNLTMETSGGATRLLNRRSRLFENSQSPEAMNKSGAENNTFTREASPANVTLTTNTAEESRPERGLARKENRDRFKTIKITRKTVNNNIPDADETNIDTEMIDTEDVVQPVSEIPAPVKAIPKPSRMLPRPKYISGLLRPNPSNMNSLKSCSADDLLDSNDDGTENVKQNQAQLKSPMGIKSKSIHNLAINGSSIGGPSRLAKYSSDNSTSSSSGNLKGPVNVYGGGSRQLGFSKTTASASLDYNPNATVNLRPTKSSGLQRPMSAAYTYQSGIVAPAKPAANRPSGIVRPAPAKSGLPKLSGIPRR